MHPELFTIPILDLGVKTYGFCLMVGFLSAVWLAMRRAQRVKASPDVILDVAFLSLVFGVGGARAFYVVHYWNSHFAFQSNKFLAIIDIRQGGLEFLGGLLGAMGAAVIYLFLKKQSLRLYFDILAPGAMWGLGFGRLGCFFNGCCFGGLCVAAGSQQASYPWAVRFPYGSPAHARAWERREVTVPAELIQHAGGQSFLLAPTALSLPVEKREQPVRNVERFERAWKKAQATDPASTDTRRLAAQLEQARKALTASQNSDQMAQLKRAQEFPSRNNPKRGTSVSELELLASQTTSPPIHPAQLYASISAFLLSGLLSAVFYVRKRHGVVIALLIVLYPISRMILEMIRMDNPHDTAGLTVSQFVSLLMFMGGMILLFMLFKTMPERSPQLDGASTS